MLVEKVDDYMIIKLSRNDAIELSEICRAYQEIIYTESDIDDLKSFNHTKKMAGQFETKIDKIIRKLPASKELKTVKNS